MTASDSGATCGHLLDIHVVAVMAMPSGLGTRNPDARARFGAERRPLVHQHDGGRGLIVGFDIRHVHQGQEELARMVRRDRQDNPVRILFESLAGGRFHLQAV